MRREQRSPRCCGAPARGATPPASRKVHESSRADWYRATICGRKPDQCFSAAAGFRGILPTRLSCSVRAELPAHLVAKLRRIVTIAIPEYEPHVPDHTRIGREVSPQYDQVSCLATLDRAGSSVLAQDARAVQCHDLNCSERAESSFDEQFV